MKDEQRHVQEDINHCYQKRESNRSAGTSGRFTREVTVLSILKVASFGGTVRRFISWPTIDRQTIHRQATTGSESRLISGDSVGSPLIFGWIPIKHCQLHAKTRFLKDWEKFSLPVSILTLVSTKTI